jgi:chromosome segregation ATPase
MADTGAASTSMEELKTKVAKAENALERAEAEKQLFLNKLTALERSLADIDKAPSDSAGAGGVDNAIIRQELREDIKAANVGFNKAQDAVTAAQATLNTLNQLRCVCHAPLTLPLRFLVSLFVVFCSTCVYMHVCV